jgi:hypothetical protein
MCLRQSEVPDTEPLEDTWTAPVNFYPCPKCGSGMWTAGWWDDSADAGGACIGTLYECGDCGEYKTH